MNKLLVWAVIIIIIIGGGYWYMQSTSDSALSGDMGSYAYTCADGSAFSMTPAEDMSELSLMAGAGAKFSGTIRLAKMGDGNHFETTSGQLVVVSGAGEEMQLTVDNVMTVCNPVPSSDMAPWNWGDAGEGAGSIQPEVSLVVTESIQGKWQSTQDAKSVREFKADGTMVDIYDGKVVSTNLFVVFTKANAPKMVAFPIEENTVYIQATEKGTSEDTLNFKLVKLTPEELELVYMDRGGTLTYKLIK